MGEAMKYTNVVSGEFIYRPNRFIANVNINGETAVCHVKNTGRCKELFVKGATVYLQKSDNPTRKTAYDIIAVQKGNILINVDSQIVNYVVLEHLPKMIPDLTYSRAEYKFGNSRFDIYAETPTRKILLEVKGVTLENERAALFPDAPTLRGVKHIKELQRAVEEGYEAYVVFVIQMTGVTHFEPNRATHPEFAVELTIARDKGVNVLAFDCTVTPDEIKIKDKTEVVL